VSAISEKSTTKKPRKKAKVEAQIEGEMSGYTFVLTGVFDIDRDKLTNILKGFGARVTSGVSKKTTHLVHGSILEDGRQVNESRKYKDAEKLGTTIFDFYQLQEFVREKLKDENLDLLNMESYSKPEENATETKPAKLEGKSYLKKKTGTATKEVNNITVITGNNLPHEDEVEANLWTTKYAPESMDDIIGNQGVVKKLSTWLDDWEDVVINENKKEVNSSFRKGKVDNPNARACIISGDPGIGKTTTVRLIAKDKGYRTFELNASDQRNKAIINKHIGYLMNSRTLGMGDQQGEIFDKNLIIMDEIDGMGGNEDRGGIAALIQIVKNTKVPIVCICNDRQSQKLKSLVNHCYDLRFNKPDKRQVVQLLLRICEAEKLPAEENALTYLVESVNNDIRQCINFLELWARRNRSLKFFDLQKGYSKFSKDSLGMMSNFEAAGKFLNKQVVR
jgi:replication factor C subunit 1